MAGWIALASMIVGGMDNESFYLCSSNEKSTTTPSKGPTANANSIEGYYANDVDQIKVIGKGEIAMIHELGTVGMVCPFPLIEAQRKWQHCNLEMN